MAESFLEAQLERIRAWTERMSQVQSYAERSRNDFVPEHSHNPLFGARDYRMLSSLPSEEDEPAEKPERAPRAEPARRRRRRRR